jgi:thioredoxin reductase (NADPH)
MPDPVLLLIDGSRTRDRVEAELRKRYGADYQVVSATSVPRALDLLDRLHEERRQVSLVLADQALPEVDGTELLAAIRRLHPTAKRVLLVSWAEQSSSEAILRAVALGHIDAYAAKPLASPDERFHRAITEQLDAWARSHLPQFEVVRVVGEERAARSHEIRELLERNGIPAGFYPAGGADANSLLGQAGVASPRLPVLVLFDGRVLTDPSKAEVAEALGVRTSPAGGSYDVTVIGAGPAGLAAAVYGASEGLSTVVLEPEAIGGQAGTSSMIRNYLGFPNGVSGEDLAVRAYTQAWNFGAEYVYGNPASGLRAADGGELVVTVAGGEEVRSRAVVVATGMSYRRLGIPELDGLTGAGVFYGAATVEAPAVRGREVYVVGGANSAGQAAIHLARYAARVTMLVRGGSLADSMSDYLVREIASTPNIEVRYRVVVTGGGGDGRLERLTLADLDSGTTQTVETPALFVLIGAEPRTQWLPDAVRRDRWGFVVTGSDLFRDGRAAAGWPLGRPPMYLESSLPGVFAVGDVRHGSVKRVASAVGEGSIAIRLVHDYLRDG